MIATGIWIEDEHSTVRDRRIKSKRHTADSAHDGSDDRGDGVPALSILVKSPSSGSGSRSRVHFLYNR